MILLSLAILAGMVSAVELDPLVEAARWTPLVEGTLAAVLIASSRATADTTFVYLAVPAVVAAIRHGYVASLNALLATTLAFAGASLATNEFTVSGPEITVASTWLAIGLGTGLLAAWLSRASRASEVKRAPFTAAHRIISQLYGVSRQLGDELDSRAVSMRMLDQLQSMVAPERAALLLSTDDGRTLRLASTGPLGVAEESLALRAREANDVIADGDWLALPMRIDGRAFGAAVLREKGRSPKNQQRSLQRYVDEQSIRLNTALLFEEVRAVAANEERNRVAREIHDGVAQDIASLGYLIDEVAETGGSETATDQLRSEISRIVNELRLSIFDLRHGLPDAGGLARAVADYAREVGSRSDFRVHLLLDAQQLQIPQYIEQELLRIAQEAIANVRKHAAATNLWVTLVADRSSLLLRVEDDGSGLVAPRAGHYGLPIMRERAARVGATLSLGSRVGGGTSLAVRIASFPPTAARGPHP